MTYNEILSQMQEKYASLTGFSPDDASDIGIRMKVLAGEVFTVYNQLEDIYAQSFAQTATGSSLDMHAQTRAVIRKAAVKSTGIIRFSRETPAGYDIPLSAGIICSTRTEPQIHFETINDCILPAGDLSVDVKARATEAGAAGNVSAKNICLIVSGAAGITRAENPADFYAGSDFESDENLRARLLASYAKISNSTNAAFYYDIAMSHSGVKSAKILPRKRGRGTVDVVICCTEEADENAVASQLSEILAREKEINVDVEVYPATPDNISLQLQIQREPSADLKTVKDECLQHIQKYVLALGVGEPLILARLAGEIMSVSGVYNFKCIVPPMDITPAPDHIVKVLEILIAEETT